MRFPDFRSFESKVILFSLILASAIGFFEATAINIAIPAIQKQYGATVTGIQWVINSYQLMLAVFMLISGSLGDIFGRKKVLLYGLCLFTIGTLLCGLTPTISWLIIARIIQGLGAACMIPQSLAIINVVYEKNIRGHAIGLWSGISGAMLIFGPFLSGLIVDSAGWKYIFLAMIPFGIITLFLVYKNVEDTRHEHKELDWQGAVLIGSGMSLLSYSFIESTDQVFDKPFMLILMLIGLCLLFAFVVWERRVKNPLINLRVFKSRNIVIANIYTLFLYSTIAALTVFTVMYLQQLRHISASVSGLMIMPISVTITILSLYSGNLADKLGVRIPMVIGALFVGVGILLQSHIRPEFDYWRDIFPGFMFIGIGFGLFIPALTKTALDVDDQFSGAASGVNYAISRIAGLFGVVFLGMIMLSSFNRSLKKEIKHISLEPRLEHSILMQKDKLLAIEVGHTNPFLNQMIRQKISFSFIRAYKYQLWLCGFLALAGATAALFVREKKD